MDRRARLVVLGLLVVASHPPYGGAEGVSPPPISQATYRAALTDSALLVQATLRVRRPAHGETEVPLFSTRFPLIGELPASHAARLIIRADAYVLQLTAPGGLWPFTGPSEEEVAFSFRVPLAKDDDPKALALLTELSKTAGVTLPAPEREERMAVLPIVPATRVLVDLPAELYDLRTVPPSPVEGGAGSTTTTRTSTRTSEGARQRLYAPAQTALVLRWRPVPPAAPTAPVFRADAEASVSVARSGLTAETQLNLQMLQGELRGLKLLLPEGSQLRALSGPAVERWETSGGAVRVELRAPLKGETRLSVTTEQLAEKSGEMVWWPLAVEGAQHQSGRAYFRAAPGLLLRAVDRKGFERVSDGYAPDEAAGRQTLVLVYPRLPASLRLAVEPLLPRLTAAIAMLAQLERGVLTERAEIDYTIHDVAVRQFQVQVGPKADVLEVTCPNLLDHELKEGVLTVRLREAVKDKTQLKLTVQRPLERVDGIIVPRLVAVGPEVERQSCLLGVAAAANIELRHERATEADQVDVRVLPEWVRKAGARLAYRYYDRPNAQVAVETAPLQPQFDVTAHETCTLSDDGWVREVAWRCEIKRGEVFAWRVLLPEGVVPNEVKGTEVKDWELLPGAAPPPAGKAEEGAAPAPLRVLRVTLARGVKGQAQLSARFTQRGGQKPSAAEGEAGEGKAPAEPPGAAPARLSRSFALPGIAIEGADRVTGRVLIQAAIAVALRTTLATGLEARRAAHAEQQLAFELRAADWKLELTASPVEPVVEVRTVTVLGARPGQVAVECALLYSIQKAPLNALTVRLPEGAVNSSVQGADIRSSKLDGREWIILLARKIVGRYPLRVTYDLVIPAEGGVAPFATLETPGAVRHEGFVLVARESDRIEVAVKQPDGLAEADPAEIGQDFRALREPDDKRAAGRYDRPFIASYRYTTRASLQAKIDVLGRAQVLQAKALGAWAETVVKENGQTLTELNYDIRNANRQFLRVELAELATLLAAYVDGAPVSSATAPDGATLIPLLGKKGTDRAVRVTVFYSQPVGSLVGGGRLKLISPPVDVRTESLAWAVYLPRGYRAQRTRGNMTLLISPEEDSTLSRAHGMVKDEGQALAPVWDWIGGALSDVGQWLAEWWGTLLVIVGVGAAIVAIALFARRAVIRSRRLRAAARLPRPQRRTRARWLARAAAVLVVAVALLLLLAAMFLPSLSRAREEARSTRARNNLTQIARAMATYLNEHGDNRFYPPGIGTLYKSGVLPDKDVFSDPSTGKPFVYLYEGRAMRDDMPPNLPMGYMEGTAGVNVLFFDSHTEFLPYGDPRLAQLIPGRDFRRPPADQWMPTAGEKRKPATQTVTYAGQWGAYPPAASSEERAAQELVKRYQKEMEVAEAEKRSRAEQHARAGQDKLEAGNSTLAVRDFEQALKADPTHREAFEGLKKAKSMLTTTEARVGDLAADYARQRAIALDVQKTEVQNMLADGKSLFEQGKFKEAIEALTRVAARARYLSATIEVGQQAEEADAYIQKAGAALHGAKAEEEKLALKLRDEVGSDEMDYSQKNILGRIAARRSREHARKEAQKAAELGDLEGDLNAPGEDVDVATTSAEATGGGRPGRKDMASVIATPPTPGVVSGPRPKAGKPVGQPAKVQAPAPPKSEEPKAEPAPETPAMPPDQSEAKEGPAHAGDVAKKPPRPTTPERRPGQQWELRDGQEEPKKPAGGPEPAIPGQPRFQARVAGGTLAAPAVGETSYWYYSRVVGGRQKGALPITFELPSEGTDPYLFHRPVTGDALGEIELDCRRIGNSRPAQGVLALGIGGLVALLALGAIRTARRKRARA